MIPSPQIEAEAAAARRVESHTHHNLARLYEIQGDFQSALSEDQIAVSLAPHSALYRLHYARGLERRGDQSPSLLQFTRALKEAQSRGEWNDAANTPPKLRALVEHAVGLIRQGQYDLYHQLLAPLIARYGRPSLERIFAAVRIYTGIESPNYSDARQRPTFFYIPGLRPSAYFDRRLFPWVPLYEQGITDIRRELEELLLSTQGCERVFGSIALERANLRGGERPPAWNGYYFYRHGSRREANCSACPITAAALDAISLIRIREHGPEALFSVFTPDTHLLPHRGVTNARAVSHLPIIIPPNCALRVGGEERGWREGETLIFDDTYEHEAWNRSSSTRVVLIADVWNPHLTEIERAAVSDVIAAIGDFRDSVERV